MKQKSAKAPVKPVNVWKDLNLPDAPEFSLPEQKAQFIEHMKAAHGIDVLKTKGKKSMTLHIDCANSYTSNYEWEIAGKKFIQFTVNPRTKADAEYWNHP